MKKLRRSCWREKERINYIEIREQLPEYFSAERQVCYLPQSTFLVSSLLHDDTHAFSSCAPFWSHRPVSWQTAIYRSPFLLLFRVKQNTFTLEMHSPRRRRTMADQNWDSSVCSWWLLNEQHVHRTQTRCWVKLHLPADTSSCSVRPSIVPAKESNIAQTNQ